MLHMEQTTFAKKDFRLYLQSELADRCQRNPRYSLRAFAKTLEINHASLSQILRGKRKLTKSTVVKFSQALGLSPVELSQFEINNNKLPIKFQQLSIDSFIAISDWYHDAILELTRLPYFKPDTSWIALVLGISVNEVNAAVDRLKRLDLLKVDEQGMWFDISGDNTNDYIGDFTNSALKKYQKQILEKALIALDEVPRDLRDHTSIMFTINKSDLKEAKKKIKEFRNEMNAFFKRNKKSSDEVYQLAVSLFPITKTDRKESL